MRPDLLRERSRIIKRIRAWFDERDFVEMHTPRLVGVPGQEPYLEPFWTEVIEASGSKHPAALITSPEYALKRLVAAGFDRVYDLGPCFRNGEPWDGTHDPEFLLLEWYRRDAGLEELMRDTEDLLKDVVSVCRPRESGDLSWVETPFRRVTVEEAMREHAGVELAPILGNREMLADVVRSRGLTVTKNDTWDDLFFKIFLTDVEPKLGIEAPTFLYRYPASMAALARRSADDPRYADRVELYAGGLELANGFAELADPGEQRARFEEERTLRRSLGKPTWDFDDRFLEALPAMGNAAGIAFGVDRLVMLLTGAKSINDIVPFPARERFSA